MLDAAERQGLLGTADGRSMTARLGDLAAAACGGGAGAVELLDGFGTALGEALTGKVKKVELTSRLKSHPCCLRAEGPVTLEMEKVLNQQALDDSQRIHAERVLELNASHPIFQKLCALQQEGSDKIKTYADILYTQALLIEGLPVDDPVAYANAVCDLIS